MTLTGSDLPLIQTTPPGPSARDWVQRLARVECPAITARRQRRGGRDPIVWAEALGANVVDTDGNRYVDLSGGFGVAAVGHRHPKVVEAARAQVGRLVHAMGDLFPSREKILLGERLAELTPGDLQHSILGANGADAVEAAIKTAMIATGRRRVLAFQGGYHGMSLGALGVSAYRDAFRAPFAGAVVQDLRLPYPSCHDCPLGLDRPTCGMACADYVERVLTDDTFGSEDVAAVIVEPIQGRGGDVVPPDGWLRRLADVARSKGILVIADEIYTGFGRTGSMFACEHEGVVPDILCVGKAMGGGAPISAAVGRAEVMEAWGTTTGEGLHTSTFLGNPLTCAMALATLDVIESEALVERAATAGAKLAERLNDALADVGAFAPVRGRGLMLGIPVLDYDGAPRPGAGVTMMAALLERGFIVSPGGTQGDVVSLSPPLVIADEQLDAAVGAIRDAAIRAFG